MIPERVTLTHKGRDLKKKLLNKNVCFDFLYNFCLKHLSFQEEVKKL
jgi:hypothetical protein